MTVRVKVKAALIATIFFAALGGMVLHYLVHPPAKVEFGYVPFVVGLVGIFVTPWLFISKKTIHAGYLLNGFSVIIGTVTMSHFALVARPIWPDLAILFPKFLAGYVLFQLEMFKPEAAPQLGIKTVRYPHFGFWVVHLVNIAFVYALGATLWS